MGGASSFLAMLGICGFLSSAWMASKVSKLVGVSSIVAEITVGVILGPQLLGIVPSEYAECEHEKYVDCEVSEELKNEIEAFTPLEDLTLTEPLHEIAHGTHHGHPFCDWEDYMHAAGWHGEEGHGDAHGADGHAGDGDAHGADGHADPDHVADGHGGDEHAAGGEDHAGDGHGAGDHGHGGDEHAAGGEDHAGGGHGAGDHGHGGNRLLSFASKGGASGTGFLPSRRLNGDLVYNSYDECLEKMCIQERTHECGLTPDVFTLIGHTGVALMIFESGMHFNFETAKVVGPWACVVAVVGTILPLVTGSILVVIFGRPFFPDGVSAGTALAPTSVGISLKLLGEAKVLHMNFGQAIITAAFVDDILSLILFNVLFALGGGELGFGTFLPSILGIIFMLVATALAVVFWPKVISEHILPNVPIRDPDAKISGKDEALFFMMMALLVCYGTITHFCGTHLWGCFIAGMSFASLKPDHYAANVWETQTKRVTKWLLRIFFCGTVAWSIPVSSLLSLEAFLKGSVMGIGPCILTKVCCGPFMGKERWVIGWAMVGRAEFAYLIAQMAAAGNMMDEMTYSVCIWALLYATIFAPFIFRAVLSRYIESEGIEIAENAHGHGHGHGENDKGANGDTTAKGGAPLHGGEQLPARGKEMEEIDIAGAINRVEAERGGAAPVPPPPSAPRTQAPKKSRGTNCAAIFGCLGSEQVNLTR